MLSDMETVVPHEPPPALPVNISVCRPYHDLVIEAGVSLLQVKKALDFQVEMIKGCIVTHRHGDHIKYVRQYADAGIPVLAPDDVLINRIKSLR